MMFWGCCGIQGVCYSYGPESDPQCLGLSFCSVSASLVFWCRHVTSWWPATQQAPMKRSSSKEKNNPEEEKTCMFFVRTKSSIVLLKSCVNWMCMPKWFLIASISIPNFASKSNYWPWHIFQFSVRQLFNYMILFENMFNKWLNSIIFHLISS